MKKIIVLLILEIMVSCDPAYSVYVANRSYDNIYVETDKEIGKDLVVKKGPFYDSIVSKKANSSGRKYFIQVGRNEKIFLFSNLGFVPATNYFPFENFKIIKGSDTIQVDKINFIQKLSKGKNRIII